MKRLLTLATMLIMCFVCKAQYNPYYNPYVYAAAAASAMAETDEVYKLNNIRFDERALSQNPDAWARYSSYLQLNEEYRKKNKIYSTIAWTGVGVTCASLIPLCMELGYDYDDPRSDAALGWSIGLLCTGGLAMTIGYIGILGVNDKAKTNKKEFIYYLKTTNNGIGIVTLF